MHKSETGTGPDAVLIRNKLKKNLSGKTYAHVKGTAKTAVMLAGRFCADKKKAEIAGLLHDCAKDMTHKELSAAISKYKVRISRHDRLIPAIWHGLIGAYVARREFGINDEEILSAVKLHSTGSARMGKIEKIIYVSDFIEPGRKYADSEKLRRLLKRNVTLDYMVLSVLKEKVKYLRQNNLLVHRSTSLLFNQIKKMNANK